MKFRQTDTVTLAAAKASFSTSAGYRFEKAPDLPSARKAPRGRSRSDPLADLFEAEIVTLLDAAPGLRDELLDGDIFYSLREAQIVIESWRRHYNTIRPHGSVGYKPPAPEVFVPAFAAWPAALTRLASPAKLPLVRDQP